MSDNSTGSSGSSINSWTLLSPEEAAIDTAGPVDDGTESIGDVPSITEEVAESTFEVKPSESETPQETVLSEEGHQVCQGTSPELFGEGATSGPSAEDDPEICAPVIHATITTSPPDNDLLGAVPFSIATESSLFLSQEPFLEAYYEEACLIPEAVAEETPECVENIGPASKPTAEIGPAFQPLSDIRPASAPVAEIGSASASVTEIFPVPEPIQEIGPASEPVTEIDPVVKPTIVIDPSLAPIAEMFPVPEPIDETDPALEPKFKISPSPEPPLSSFPDVTADVLDISHTSAIPGLDIGPCPDISSSSLSSKITHSPAAESLFPETPASSVLEEKDLVTDRDEHKSTYVARQAEPVGPDEPIEHGGEDSGLRQRRVHYPEEPRQSSDEEDVEEMEFRLPERKEEKPGLSMNHLIIGALALLCLGAFLISGTFFDQAGDDFDGTELSDQELLEKLVEENKQISILEAQIQAQKEELDQALRAAAEKGITDKEHARMKEELSALPGLKAELQALKARVSELTQLTAGEGQSPAGPARLWGNNDELKRQKLLLEQSKTRLETMKKQDWPKKWLGERLVEMQQRLSDQVDHISKKDEWRRKQKGAETRKNDWSDGVQKHKEFLKKYRDEWEQTKPERKVERERRKQERSLQARSGHKQKHDHRADQHFESKDFWKLQEKKLRKKRNPPRHCQGMSGCADAEGLVHVKLSAFLGLLDTYLNKLQGLSAVNKEAFHRLVSQFFHNGIFPHNKMLFSEFAKNVADILEDLADLLMDDDVLEEEMEEFEREVLWHFAI